MSVSLNRATIPWIANNEIPDCSRIVGFKMGHAFQNKGFCYEKVSTVGIVLQYTEGGLFPYLVFNFNMVLGSKNKNLPKCALSLLCLRIRLAGSRYDKYLINLSRKQLSFFVS